MSRKSDSVLWRHPNGQWCKKVRGRAFYFGTDYDAAVKRWLAEKDHILAGVPVPKEPSAVSAAILRIIEPLLTPAEVADLLRISPREVQSETVPRGTLQCVQIGTHIRYAPEDLRKYIAACKVQPPAQE